MVYTVVDKLFITIMNYINKMSCEELNSMCIRKLIDSIYGKLKASYEYREI